MRALKEVQSGFCLQRQSGAERVSLRDATGRIDEVEPEKAAEHLKMLRNATHGHGTNQESRAFRTEACSRTTTASCRTTLVCWATCTCLTWWHIPGFSAGGCIAHVSSARQRTCRYLYRALMFAWWYLPWLAALRNAT